MRGSGDERGRRLSGERTMGPRAARHFRPRAGGFESIVDAEAGAGQRYPLDLLRGELAAGRARARRASCMVTRRCKRTL